MSYPVPKIVYPAGGGTTLNFTFPPMSKPGVMERSTDGSSVGGTGSGSTSRQDSITLSGLQQTMWYRTDWFKTLQMDFVPIADLPNWKAFMDYAIQGGQFDYYPDATTGVFQTMTLEETDWNPEFSFRAPDPAYGGVVKFSMKMRWISGYES